MRSAEVACIASQGVLAVYLQVVEWVPMPPWNDLRRGNSQARLDIGIGFVQAGLIAGVAAGVRSVMIVAAILYALWLGLQIKGWWIPYLRGASQRGVAFHENEFGSTWKFLPRTRRDRPPPDGNHVVLQLLIFSALVTSCIAVATSH